MLQLSSRTAYESGAWLRRLRRSAEKGGSYVAVIIGLLGFCCRADMTSDGVTVEDFLTMKTFARDSIPFTYSPDGKWFAAVVCDENMDREDLDSGTYRHLTTGMPRDAQSCGISLKNRATGAGRVISSGDSYGPVWSPKGDDLAFYTDEGGLAQLWIFDCQTGRRHRVSSAILHPRWTDDVPIWSPDGEYIYAVTIPEGMTLHETQVAFEDSPIRTEKTLKNSPTRIVFRAGPKAAATSAQILNDLPSNLAQTSDLVRVQVRTGSLRRMLRRKRIGGVRLSPNGRYISFASGFGYASASVQQKTYKLQVLDVETLQLFLLIGDWRTNAGSGYSWSPNSKHIAAVDYDYFRGGRCRIFNPIGILEADSGTETEFIYDFTGPSWTLDSTKLWLKTSDSIFEYSVDTQRFRHLATLQGNSIIAVVGTKNFQASGDDDGVVAIARDEDTKALHVVSVRSDGRTSVGPAQRISIDNFERQPEVDIDLLPLRREFAVVAESVERPFDVVVFDVGTLSPARFETEINPRLSKARLGSSQLLTWTGIHAEKIRGALLVPPQWDGVEKIPAVVVQYPRAVFSSNLYTFGLHTQGMNWQMLASEGIAVLAIDLPLNSYKINEISQQLNTAITALAESGIVDSTRVGLYGCSSGAYTAVAGIEGTDSFRAAVADSPVGTDLVANYLQIGEHGENGSSAWGEKAFGASLFGDKQLYVDNSPTLQLDRVHTPLLIAKGTNDSVVYMGDELFGGLQLLGREAKYIKYVGGGHCLGRFGRANDKDFIEEMVDWFKSHLSDAVGPSHVQ